MPDDNNERSIYLKMCAFCNMQSAVIPASTFCNCTNPSSQTSPNFLNPASASRPLTTASPPVYGELISPHSPHESTGHLRLSHSCPRTTSYNSICSVHLHTFDLLRSCRWGRGRLLGFLISVILCHSRPFHRSISPYRYTMSVQNIHRSEKFRFGRHSPTSALVPTSTRHL